MMRASWLWSALVCALGLTACSVDEHKNPQRMSCAECKLKHGDCVTPQYCLLPSGTQADASTPDAGKVVEGCDQENQREFCYDAADQSTSQQPPCHAGTRTCHNGVWGPCDNQMLPGIETCNHIDDDCDGNFDEDVELGACDVPDQQGQCKMGSQACIAGELKCGQINFAKTDTCNGMDDDCDGHTDEGTELRCYPDDTAGCMPSSTSQRSFVCSGRCEPGTRACVDGSYSDKCEGSVVPDSEERCTDPGAPAFDEDCDGNTDEGCTCKAGVTCYTGSPSETQLHAPCHAGMQACTDSTHGSCKDEVTPKPEDCSNEGTDDDCDGVMDNIPARGVSCSDASKAVGACKAAAHWQCQDGKQVCVDGNAGSELCDGQKQDEDCDGKIDEGFDLLTDENHCGACNHVCGTGLTCCGGACVNISASKSNCGKCGGACASAETCCGGSCANTTNDASNCGSCGNGCGLLSGCVASSCKLLQ